MPLVPIKCAVMVLINCVQQFVRFEHAIMVLINQIEEAGLQGSVTL